MRASFTSYVVIEYVNGYSICLQSRWGNLGKKQQTTNPAVGPVVRNDVITDRVMWVIRVDDFHCVILSKENFTL